jgi:hypothetical protein
MFECLVQRILLAYLGKKISANEPYLSEKLTQLT